jgi:hypothetical protein
MHRTRETGSSKLRVASKLTSQGQRGACPRRRQHRVKLCERSGEVPSRQTSSKQKGPPPRAVRRLSGRCLIDIRSLFAAKHTDQVAAEHKYPSHYWPARGAGAHMANAPCFAGVLPPRELRGTSPEDLNMKFNHMAREALGRAKIVGKPSVRPLGPGRSYLTCRYDSLDPASEITRGLPVRRRLR